MSKRSKFLLVTWVGLGVSPIKKAKMSTDKALVKEILAVSLILPGLLGVFDRLVLISSSEKVSHRLLIFHYENINLIIVILLIRLPFH